MEIVRPLAGQKAAANKHLGRKGLVATPSEGWIEDVVRDSILGLNLGRPGARLHHLGQNQPRLGGLTHVSFIAQKFIFQPITLEPDICVDVNRAAGCAASNY
jgi:hypothetical protein